MKPVHPRALPRSPALATLVAFAVAGLSSRGAWAQPADRGAPAPVPVAPTAPAPDAQPVPVPPPAPVPQHADETDRFDLQARSATYLRYFQRALLPGPNGAAVSTDSLAMAYEYLTLRASNIDAPWGRDDVDAELSAWGGLSIGDLNDHLRRLDGDVTSANVRLRFGPAYVRIGRQIFVGGAARFAQFDGISAGIRAPAGLPGLGVDGYAGFTVLPRWSGKPNYYLLGSAADTLLRSPDAIAAPTRSGSWLGGARAYYEHARYFKVGLGYHERRETACDAQQGCTSELGLRNASADLTVTPIKYASLSAQGVMDLDSFHLADGRVWADVYPMTGLQLTGEYLRTDPSLFLSRQSVLSVFGSAPFDELGGDVTWRPLRRVEVGGAGYIEMFDGDRRGGRGNIRLKVIPDSASRTSLQLVYGRVVDVDNGYYSWRLSGRFRVATPLTLTAESYAYLYDQRIRGIAASYVEAANAEWEATHAVRVMLGGSITSSPYAALDAQTLLRLVVNSDYLHGAKR